MSQVAKDAPDDDHGAVDHDADTVLGALDELVAAGRDNVVAWVGLMARADEIRDQRRRGLAYKDMAIAAGVPIIDAISANQDRLNAAAARYRRAMAHMLHDEGLSPAAIARIFGVSRQRIASLLAHDSGWALPMGEHDLSNTSCQPDAGPASADQPEQA